MPRVIVFLELYLEAEDHRDRGVTWDWRTVYPSPPHLQRGPWSYSGCEAEPSPPHPSQGGRRKSVRAKMEVARGRSSERSERVCGWDKCQVSHFVGRRITL